GTCPVAQDFCQLIVEDSWLNQMDDVIVGHGISLLRWRSGGVKHPHDMPPFRFPPSPTLGDSSVADVSIDDAEERSDRFLVGGHGLEIAHAIAFSPEAAKGGLTSGCYRTVFGVTSARVCKQSQHLFR